MRPRFLEKEAGGGGGCAADYPLLYTPPPPGLCSMLGSRLAYCLCRWVSERAHPLRACSHGNGSDSEQLVFVFFGNVATAGILTGTGEVWYAKTSPGRPLWKQMFSLWLSPVCFYSHAELFGHTAPVEFSVFHLSLGDVDQMEFMLQRSLHATGWQAELVLESSQSSGGSWDPF